MLSSPSQYQMETPPAEVCPDCACDKQPEKSYFARDSTSFWRPVSRSSGAFLSRSSASIHSTQLKVTRWFSDLPPVRWFEARYPGWQAGVVTAISVGIFVLLFNLIFLIVAMRNRWGLDGLGTLVEGDCDKIDRWNKIAHGFINIMSTFLLMQSNYCMQLLAAPTRYDVDVAHRKREWVDIGIQSFRNVWKRHINPWRCFYWTVLAVSSVPLHLLWNSVVIFSPSAFQYNELTVTEEFVNGTAFDYNGYFPLTNSDPTLQGAMYPDNLLFIQKQLSEYVRLEPQVCKREYAQDFVRDRSDLIVVTSETKNTSLLGAASGGWGPWPYRWLCPSDQGQNFKCYNEIRKLNDTWQVPTPKNGKVEVAYCLSKEIKAKCKLQYGFWIALFTIIANFFKVICFVITYRVMKFHTQHTDGANSQLRHGEKLLITTDDAIASFLENPDNETIGMSIVEKQDFKNGIWALRWVSIQPMLWRERSECSWFRAIGIKRWLCGIFPIVVLAFGPAIFLLSKLNWLANDIGLSQPVLQQLGIGNPSGLFLFGSRTTAGDQFLGWKVLGKVALGNLPQLVISIAYYLWNNQLSAMIAAREYGHYAAPRRSNDEHVTFASKHGLRLTDPVRGSDQRSTRFLTVPLHYWIFNVVLWTLLHYIASQSIFFARVDVLDHWLRITDWSISQVGYSVLGLIYFLVIAQVVFIYAMWVSLRRLPNQMPLAATCSGALSAACHPRDRGVKHHERRVQWGVEIVDDRWSTGTGMRVLDDDRRVLQCTFTSGEAYYPEAGRFYA